MRNLLLLALTVSLFACEKNQGVKVTYNVQCDKCDVGYWTSGSRFQMKQDVSGGLSAVFVIEKYQFLEVYATSILCEDSIECTDTNISNDFVTVSIHTDDGVDTSRTVGSVSNAHSIIRLEF